VLLHPGCRRTTINSALVVVVVLLLLLFDKWPSLSLSFFFASTRPAAHSFQQHPARTLTPLCCCFSRLATAVFLFTSNANKNAPAAVDSNRLIRRVEKKWEKVSVS
jgi:hypothetical protein